MIKQISKDLITSSEWVFYKEITDNLSDYEDLLIHLAKMKIGDYITLHLCCPGGSCDVGFKIIDAIKKCKGGVYIVVENTCYSMGALIAISGKSIEFSKHSSLMFHTFSYGTFGKSDEIRQFTDNTDRVYKDHIDEVCYPFLTKTELRSMHDCKDIYVSWDDKDLDKRIGRMFK